MIRKLSRLGLALAGLAAFACNQAATPAPSPTPAGLDFSKASEEQKALYALGVLMARNASSWQLQEAELPWLIEGLKDTVNKKDPRVDLTQVGPRMAEVQKTRQALVAAPEKAKHKPFLDAEAAKPGAQVSSSGLIYFQVAEGKGGSPGPDDAVAVNYRGTLPDGTEFDSSYKRGQPVQFRLSRVIPCWTEGLQRMKVNGKARLVCPSDIAYGDGGSPPTIPPGTPLVFEVELLGMAKVKDSAQAPAGR